MLADARAVITLWYINLSNQHVYLIFLHNVQHQLYLKNKLEKKKLPNSFSKLYNSVFPPAGHQVLVPPHPRQHVAWSIFKISAIPTGMVSHPFHLHFPNNQ